MDKKDIRLEARLQALEYLLCNFCAQPLRARPSLIADQKRRNQELLDRLDRFTVPGVDPVQSVYTAAELQDAVKVLLDTISEMAEAQ